MRVGREVTMNTTFRSGFYSSPFSSVPIRSRQGTSVYGGADGKSVRVSYPSNSFGSGFDYAGMLAGGGVARGSFTNSGNKKVTMQNLNDRLAAYLEKVRSLESANVQLERQICGWYDKKMPTVRGSSKYELTTDDLRGKISAATQDNARLMLQIENARLAAEDFRIKFENEQAMRTSVETDIAGLRRVLDDLTTTRSDLEMQVEGLKEELVYLKENHAEEMAALRGQITDRSVNVEVDAKPQGALTRILEQIRSQYDGITEKNRRDMEAWYEGKFADVNKQVVSSTETLQTSRSESSEHKKSLQALQIELQSQLSVKSALEGHLAETESRYSLQLSQLQAIVNSLQEELKQVRVDIERQVADYHMLLDIKTRLELEIAEYRRLLDGEEPKKSVNVPTTVVKEEAKAPSVRRKVVIEEIVDGKVVSRTEDVDTEVISK